MVTIWTQALLSAAELSNFFSSLGVIICFLCMVVFIMRVQGSSLNTSSVVHIGHPGAVQMKYQKIEIPFTCSVSPGKEISHTKEIVVHITTKTSCSLQTLWHVSCERLNSILHLPWEQFEKDISDINSADALEIDLPYELDAASESHILKISIKEDLPPLGAAPRKTFPLLILLKRLKSPIDHYEEHVGALLAIAHISDKECPMDSCILYQYLKQYSGQFSQLKPLYTQKHSVTHSEVDAADINLPSNSSEVIYEETCVVCRVNIPTRALLPCRHVCVCANCFPHLETCPLCRSPFSAYFLIDEGAEEENSKDAPLEEEDALNMARHQSFLNNMNGVLNSILGIRD